MGQYNWAFSRMGFTGTAYLDVGFPTEIKLTSNRYDYTMPTALMRCTHNGVVSSRYYYNLSIGLYSGDTLKSSLGTYGNTNTVYDNNTWASAAGRNVSFYTSSHFNSNNPTVRSISYSFKTIGFYMNANGNASDLTASSLVNVGNVTFTLDVPPTFEITELSYTAPAYTGVTTVSVTVSNATAYYGGNIASATLTIGNQSETISGNGTISMLLNEGGTFTPKVTVMDSRGQKTTKALEDIVVNVYSKPSVSFDTERTTSSGVLDDEGTYAVINPTFTFTDAIATLSTPTVSVTDQDGITSTVTPTWYSSRAQDGTLSGSVTWANLSSGDTVYGLISGFNTQYSYQISVTPEDSKDTGATQTQTLGSAFYTIDFLAGGHGIAFGKPATNEGFECAMDAIFKNAVNIEDEIYIDLSNYTVSGDIDKELYDAIVALGWDNDVLTS